MKRNNLLLIILLAVMVALVGTATAACTLTVPSFEVRTYQDVTVSAGTFTNGLAGYNLTFTVADPTKAEITEVTFPSWANINTCGSLPASSVTCTAADLGAQIQAGAGTTSMCTVRVKSLAKGDTTLGVVANSFDDDVGGAIAPSVVNGTLSSMTSARVMANTTFTPVSTEAYQNIYWAIGGNQSPQTEAEVMINWTNFLGATLMPYTLLIGYLAFVIIFAIPFVLMWLMQMDLTPAAIAGIIIGGFMLVYLPAEYSLLAGIFVVMAAMAIVYSLMKERM